MTKSTENEPNGNRRPAAFTLEPEASGKGVSDKAAPPAIRRPQSFDTDIVLTPDDLARIEAVFPRGAAAGERYAPGGMSSLNR